MRQIINALVQQEVKESSELSQTKYHHGDLKSALINAAEVMLREKGTEALSLRTLAAEVGVSHMAPYAHFKNKAELFQAIAAYGFNSLADRMEGIDNTLSPEQHILAYGAAYIEFALANAPLYRLMLSQTQAMGPDKASIADHLSADLTAASKRPFNMLKSEFARLIEDPLLCNIKAQGAWSLVHGMAALLIDGHLSIPENMSVKSFLARAAIPF